MDVQEEEEHKGEDVETQFAMLIRERMTEDEFWTWVRTWKDSTVLVQQAEEWDTKTKEEEIPKIRDIISRVNRQ